MNNWQVQVSKCQALFLKMLFPWVCVHLGAWKHVESDLLNKSLACKSSGSLIACQVYDYEKCSETIAIGNRVP